MNYSERGYEFKTLLLEVHKKNIRDYSKKALADEIEILSGTVIDLSQINDEVVLNATRDFEDFLFTSMDVCVYISKFNVSKQNAIILSINKDIGEGSGYMGYRINVNSHNITIEGYDNRGIAQALYFLEDLIRIRKAPFLKKQVICRKAVFERRISQSPFGMFEWPDEALSHLAHSGMDTMALWLKEFNKTKQDSYIDVNLLAERASKFGIDIYVTFYKQHNVHPTDENAYEFYDGIYGKLLKACPKIKGLFLLGEATEFSSKDPNVGFAPRQKNYIDNIPTGKCTPGWWPCSDYAEWVDLIKKVARKYNSELDVVLSTYNWGYAPEKDRIALINRLPQDVSINVTWDMFEQVHMGNSVQDGVDYSLNFVGPGTYFTSEAISAGHPDKICDQISDALLDFCVAYDKNSRVAIECLVTERVLVIAGELTTDAILNNDLIVEIAKRKIKEIGYTDRNLGFSFDDIDVAIFIHSQSKDIALGVDKGGAGDQGIMFGGAVMETNNYLPVPIALATKIMDYYNSYIRTIGTEIS